MYSKFYKRCRISMNPVQLQFTHCNHVFSSLHVPMHQFPIKLPMVFISKVQWKKNPKHCIKWEIRKWGHIFIAESHESLLINSPIFLHIPQRSLSEYGLHGLSCRLKCSRRSACALLTAVLMMYTEQYCSASRNCDRKWLWFVWATDWVCRVSLSEPWR